MRPYLVTCMVLFVLSACAVRPFNEAEHAAPRTSASDALVERFRDRVPDSFQLVNSIVFEYNYFTFSGVGFIEMDAASRSYKVACMNNLGVKLLEFEGAPSGLKNQFAIGPLAGKGDVAAAVAKDIRRIYLDRVPSSGTRAIKQTDQVKFRQRSGWGALEYVFKGPEGNLAAKTYMEDHRPVWRVSYYDYQHKNEKVYPTRIMFKHYRHGYRLIVRQKEIRS